MIGATFKLELSGPDLSFRDRAIVRDAGTGCPGRSDSADSDKRRHSLSVASYVYHPHAEPSPLVHGGPIIESSNQLGWLKASWFPVQMRIRGSFPICYCAASDETNYLASLGISLPPAESPCDRDNALYHYAGASDDLYWAKADRSQSSAQSFPGAVYRSHVEAQSVCKLLSNRSARSQSGRSNLRDGHQAQRDSHCCMPGGGCQSNSTGPVMPNCM